VFQEEMYREDEPFIGCMGLISREGIHKPAYNAYRFLAEMGVEQVELTVEGAGDVGGMASRSADGGVQVTVYNGQNPGAGPSDGVYYEVTPPQEIGLTVSGLDPETAYDVTLYRVDEERGNAYAVWESMGRPDMPSMSEADWQALRDAMDSPAEPIGEALCGETFSQTFSLSSPGALLLTLTPSLAEGS
jgi:xylan 1,4-beta-xylosidase